MSPLRFCRNEDVKMKKLLSLWLLLCTTASASPYQIAIHDEAFSGIRARSPAVFIIPPRPKADKTSVPIRYSPVLPAN